MKSSCLKLTALILLLMMVFAACAPVEPQGDNDTTDNSSPSVTEQATTEEITTEEATTEAPVSEKKVKNILMIGNSFCYYYVEELCGIAAADGYELNVANLYKSGAKISEHHQSYLTDSKIATLFLTTGKKRKEIGEFSFKEALEYAQKTFGENWDVISLQSSGYYALIGDLAGEKSNTMIYAKLLYKYLKENYSDAELYWHQSWAYEIGYGKDKSEPQQMNTVEHRTSMHQIKREVSYMIAEQSDVKLVPTGDAWEIARQNALIGTTLCKRLEYNNGEGDYYHDGDIGGGQYLNACVWYEVLMGKSCVGNTWRPPYELSEEKIAILQAAAHEAVAAVYGADHAK